MNERTAKVRIGRDAVLVLPTAGDFRVPPLRFCCFTVAVLTNKSGWRQCQLLLVVLCQMSCGLVVRVGKQLNSSSCGTCSMMHVFLQHDAGSWCA